MQTYSVIECEFFILHFKQKGYLSTQIQIGKYSSNQCQI